MKPTETQGSAEKITADLRGRPSQYETAADRQAEIVALSAWEFYNGADEVLSDDPEATAQTKKVIQKVTQP